MKPFLAALLLACTLSLGYIDPGGAASHHKLSFSESDLFRGNPQAPELYRDIARLYQMAEQEVIARLVPPAKPAFLPAAGEVIAAPAVEEPAASEPSTGEDHSI